MPEPLWRYTLSILPTAEAKYTSMHRLSQQPLVPQVQPTQIEYCLIEEQRAIRWGLKSARKHDLSEEGFEMSDSNSRAMHGINEDARERL